MNRPLPGLEIRNTLLTDLRAERTERQQTNRYIRLGIKVPRLIKLEWERGSDTTV